MAKLAFSKLNLKLNKDVQNVQIGENTIEVLQYLPQEDKAKFIEYVLNEAIDSTGGFSPIRIETFFALALLKFYTNLTFTDKQLADAGKLYDLLESNGILDKVIAAIPQDEFEFINTCVADTARDLTQYNTSLIGMLKNASNDASGLNEQLNSILAQLSDNSNMESLSLVKDVFKGEI